MTICERKIKTLEIKVRHGNIGKVKERTEERITKGKGELNVVLRDAQRCSEMTVDVFEE